MRAGLSGSELLVAGEGFYPQRDNFSMIKMENFPLGSSCFGDGSYLREGEVGANTAAAMFGTFHQSWLASVRLA
jgi:hypothetical protein